jgi:RNA polymerase sigma-70 factor (ECF subfamily)
VANILASDTIAGLELPEDGPEGLVRAYGRLVYSIAFSVLRNPHDAEDATQEVLVRLLRKDGGLSGIRDPVAYVACIAWRVAVDSRRRHKEISLDSSTNDGLAADVEAELKESRIDLEQSISDREIMRLVENAIRELPEDLRDAITLSTVEELSAARVGELLGVAEGTVRTRVFRARKLLREKVAHILEKHHV